MQRQPATARITATEVTVLKIIRRVFMDSYCTSPALFDDLFQCKINACGTFHHDRRGIPRDIGPKSLKMKRRNIVTCVTVKDRRDVFIVTNMHACSVQGNFTDDPGRAIKQCLRGDCRQVRQNGE